MKELIEPQLAQLESDIDVYNTFLNHPAVPRKDREVVSLKLVKSLITFAAFHDLVPEYVPKGGTIQLLGAGLNRAANFVSIENGQVKISPEYDEMLKEQQALINKGK